MTHIEDYIDKIARDGDIQEMIKLSKILEDTIDIVKDYEPEKYKKYEMCLYKMAYGDVLSRDMAEEIVSKMKPYRMKWSYEETTAIKNDYGYDDISPVDFFVVMNSAYNDYRAIFGEDIETYARFSELFINDEDAKEGKVFNYFTIIPQ